mgnify:FL=1
MQIFRTKIITVGIVLGALFIAGVALGWNDPTATPPQGAGALKAGTNGGGLKNRQNLGINLLAGQEPSSTTTVRGNFAVGKSFAFVNQSGNPDGAIIEGSLGLGTTTPRSPLTIQGGVKLGGTSLRFSPSHRVPGGNVSTEIEANATTHMALTIGSDGLPIVTYLTGGNLWFARCTRLDCTAWNKHAIEASVGQTAITIGGNGFPVLAHVVASNGALRVLQCSDLDCINFTGTAADASVSANQISLAIATDGCPSVAYRKSVNSAFRTYFATTYGSGGCATWSSNPVDNTVNSGRYLSLSSGSDGFPIMSYYTQNQGLWVARCGSMDCGNSVSQTQVNAEGPATDLGQFSSLALGKDGYPIISYYAGGSGGLRIVHCTSRDCTSFDTFSDVEEARDLGRFSSLSIGADGLPGISYFNGNSITPMVRFAKCAKPDCSLLYTAGSEERYAWPRDVAGTVASQPFTSLAIGSDGLPVIAYRSSGGGFSVLKCGSIMCIPYWTRK